MLRIVATRTCAEQPSSSNSHVETLKKQLATPQYRVNPSNRELEKSGDDRSNDLATAVEVAWMEIDKLVKSQSDYIGRSLPGFWKIAKACMDGKYRKVCPASLICPSLTSSEINLEF
jgi:exocyst complex component 2